MGLQTSRSRDPVVRLVSNHAVARPRYRSRTKDLSGSLAYLAKGVVSSNQSVVSFEGSYRYGGRRTTARSA